LVVLALSSLVACLPEAPPPIDDLTPRIELGTHRAEFEGLRDGDTVELVNGPQGGFHIDLAVRLHRVDPVDSTLTYAVFHHDARIDVAAEYAVNVRRFRSDGEHRLLRTGDRAVLDVPSADAIADEDVVITVELETEDSVFTDSCHVLVAP